MQNTIENGISKIEKGFEKGKNKMDSRKEISQLNKKLNELDSRKQQSLQELGSMVYNLVSKGLIENEEIKEKCNNIAGYQHLIYENKKEVEDIKILKEGFKCGCGNTLYSDDKFCGNCGKKVEIQEEEVTYITCRRCETEINEEANFCPCCGIKLSLLGE
ncbi:zinc ribbon domain-containing protein [Paraclostridium bifermentans]|uniref:zinc ribbon domain-containing protein n=1 Tax=Paraclostridium bifermentans TaxID=1490 RepID=UPI00359C132A